jgi:hypothetical protein
MDDMIIISHDMINWFKQLISNKFCIKDFGQAPYIPGIKLTRTLLSSLALTQENYTQSILETFNMADTRTTPAPMVANTRLTKATDTDHQPFLQLKINYCKALGLLNYLSVSTRLDILHCLTTFAASRKTWDVSLESSYPSIQIPCWNQALRDHSQWQHLNLHRHWFC